MGNVTVAAGVTLTIEPEVVVQFQETCGLWIEGNLHAVGTSGSMITFTGTTEDEGSWRYINVQGTGSGTLEWCTIAYAGWYNNAGLLKSGTGALSLKNCAIRNIYGDGLRISSGYASFLSSNNTFSNNNYGVRLGHNTSFDDATSRFDGNNVDLYADGGNITQDVTWNLYRDYSVYVSSNITVAVGARLTVRPGTVVKFSQTTAIWVQGEMDARGMSEAPIYFTDWRDDTVGGDANQDGDTTEPAPDWWRYINVQGTGSTTLEWCTIAYGGYYDYAGVLKTGTGSLSLKNSAVRNINGDGLRIDSSTGSHEIIKCGFADNNNGLLVRNQSSGITVSGSRIEGNTTYGVLNQATAEVDARSCWWGHASGPYHPTKNPDGQGDTVSDNVLFEPWKQSESSSDILSPVRSGTLVKGDALRFLGSASEDPTAQYAWDLGDGRSSTLREPGVLNFPSTGVNPVAFALVFKGEPDPYPDTRTYTVVDDTGVFPDLAVTRATIPPSLTVGQAAQITYSAHNRGDSALEGVSWTDAIYLSQDPYLDTQDTLLSSVTVSLSLEIGATYDGAITITLPAVEEGAYYLILSVDDAWEVVEWRQLNNEYAVSINVLVPVIDAGVEYTTPFVAGQVSHYYRMDVPAGQNLRLLFDASLSGLEVYVRFGAIPTRDVYDYRLQGTELLIPAARGGIWYILVYGDSLPLGGEYTILFETVKIALLSVTPEQHGTTTPLNLTVTGAGFVQPLQVALVTGGGTVYGADSVEVDAFTSLTATFTAGAIPPGIYAVRVSGPDIGSDELPSALEIVDGGTAKLETKLILPERFGYHQLATVYVEYANTGDASMPAPLLLVRPTQKGNPGAILTLDQTSLSSGFWTSVMPEGFANEVQFLASGETPGLLQPGESRRVPIYYAGWQKPWDFS